jgi:hypothetical protein
MSKNKTPDIISGNNKQVISAPLISKDFIKKNGDKTKRKEIYIRRSIQDYFIKFCESKVSYEALQKHLPKTEFEIKTVKLEVEFREGNWDVCDEKKGVQSRTGPYVVIHRLIEK